MDGNRREKRLSCVKKNSARNWHGMGPHDRGMEKVLKNE